VTKPHHWARMCPKCQRKPVAHPKAVYCYDCRLCYRRRRALARLEGGDVTDDRRAEAIVGGHQLFFDGMEHKLAMG